MRGYGQYGQITIPSVTKPELPGYVTSESCAAQVGVLQKKWDDHVPVMVVGGIAAIAVAFFIGKAM
jgi:hypothetical protein